MTSATPTTMNMMVSRNPTTGEVHQTFPETPDASVRLYLDRADRAYRETLTHPFLDVVAARTRFLRHTAAILESGVEEYARIVTREMGKTFVSAKAEILKCAKTCRYYAEHGPTMLHPEPAKRSDGTAAEVRHEPIGVVLAIMPWNFPFWQAIRCAAPILLSGNSFLLKHASNVPESALAIEAVFHEACRREKLDPAIFSTLLLPSSRIEALIADPRIRGVTLTGSERAGRRVASEAGTYLKKTVLELGGSDPFIVFPTADLDLAISAAAESRLIANGQSCIAAKRFIVHESLYSRFRDGLLAKFRGVKLGDPMDAATTLGPLASKESRELLHALVVDAEKKGAQITHGGEIPAGAGFFYPATILENIPSTARIYREEAFGPVASLYRFQTHDEMLALANATPYGLGASIWTRENHEVELCARRLESGQLFVNEIVASDPGIPFGGMKDSGYGRELGLYGVREWTATRTLVRKT